MFWEIVSVPSRIVSVYGNTHKIVLVVAWMRGACDACQHKFNDKVIVVLTERVFNFFSAYEKSEENKRLLIRELLPEIQNHNIKQTRTTVAGMVIHPNVGQICSGYGAESDR